MGFAAKLETKRLRLGPVRLGDFVFFWRLVGNAKVREFLGGPVPWHLRVVKFRQYLCSHPKAGIWMVRPKTSKSAIGVMVLNPHKNGTDYEISYQFHPSSWGQGFAGEATARLVEYGLDDLGLHRVIAETQSANAASCHMLLTLGFREEERLKRFGAEQVIFVNP